MRICVTGGAGYIGSHVCKALAQAGHEVFVYDNLSTGHRSFAQWGPLHHGDIRDAAAFRACLRACRPDGIIHFAALSCVGESVVDPGKYFSNNVAGTLNMLEVMRDEGCSAIVVSGSAAVYGQPEVTPISENCPPKPINPYGASKLFMERMLADFAAAHDLRWVSLRYFNAAGASPEGEIGELHHPETHLIPRVIFAALRKTDAVDLFGTDYPTPDGSCIRDYIHVDDLADAHIRALTHLLEGGENMALNLGSGKGASVREIIRGVEKIAGRAVPCRERERRPGDPATLVADASKAAATLGWRPEKDLSEILADAWNFLAAQKNLRV